MVVTEVLHLLLLTPSRYTLKTVQDSAALEFDGSVVDIGIRGHVPGLWTH